MRRSALFFVFFVPTGQKNNFREKKTRFPSPIPRKKIFVPTGQKIGFGYFRMNEPVRYGKGDQQI